MSFFTNFFHTDKKKESAVLIDVGVESVAGAYAYYEEGKEPEVLYTRRLPVEGHAGESREKAMLRALTILGDTLIREGSPVLARATGSGSAGSILVSVDAPWQKTMVRTEAVEEEDAFVFTKELVRETLEKTNITIPGKLLVDESIIGTILNGYETRDPYGKRVHRASIVILTSFVDEEVATDIATTLRGVFHSDRVLPIAGGSLRSQAVHCAFPHERNALILDATGPHTTIALVRKGLFVAILEGPKVATVKAWQEHVVDSLADLGRRYPLPRTIFLLARDTEVARLRTKLETADMDELWLSDNPPKVVSVLASHVAGLVRQVTTAAPDLPLLLMALFWSRTLEDKR